MRSGSRTSWTDQYIVQCLVLFVDFITYIYMCFDAIVLYVVPVNDAYLLYKHM